MPLRKNTLKKTILSFTVAGAIVSIPIYGHAALGDRVLVQGSQHNDVKELQASLKELGYYNYKDITDYFGTITRQALLDFQKANGLAADGSFGPASFKKMVEVLDGKTSSSKPTPPAPTPKPNPDTGSDLSYSRPLSLGLRGEDVKKLQDILKNLGYLKISQTTDFFGAITRQALLDFQKDHGLEIDGFFGPSSFKKINEVLKGGDSDPKPSEPSRGDEDRRALTIKIIATAKQYIGVPYLYAGSDEKGFDCSGYAKFVYEKHGISIPRTVTTQALAGVEISREDLQVGDLLVFSDTYVEGPSHSGIYIGNDNFIHASSSGVKGVTISSLNEEYYNSRFSFARRFY